MKGYSLHFYCKLSMVFMMKINELLEKEFFDKLSDNDYVGIEIEMPLINNRKPYQIDNNIIQTLFKELLKNNFTINSYDNDNNIISLKNYINGDTISLEYSLNTIEFSLSKELNIYNLIDKFNNYYNFINEYLDRYDYKLCDSGINPNYKLINRSSLNHDRYKIIENLLYNEDNKLFSQFCSYCASLQTHINVSKERITSVFNLFTLINDNKDNMFANSYMEETGLNNSRKYLWKNSNFGPFNVGNNKIYKDINDIRNDYLNRNLFFVQRDNKFYLLKNRYSLIDYFNKEEVIVILEDGSLKSIKPLYSDFDNFRSYKDVEITRYGTLEIRTDCTQRLENMFKIVAFNVGVSLYSEEIIKYINENNCISNDKLYEYAVLGLKKRGYNEEMLLFRR